MKQYFLLHSILSSISIQLSCFTAPINADNNCQVISIPWNDHSSILDHHIQLLQKKSSDDVTENCLNITFENTNLNHKQIMFMKFEMKTNQSDLVETKLLYSMNNSKHMFENQTEVKPNQGITIRCKILFSMDFKVAIRLKRCRKSTAITAAVSLKNDLKNRTQDSREINNSSEDFVLTNASNNNTSNVAEDDSKRSYKFEDFFKGNLRCITHKDKSFDENSTSPNMRNRELNPDDFDAFSSEEENSETLSSENDNDSDSTEDGTTIIIPTEVSPDSPEESQIEWKIISLIFIALSVGLFIVSIFLWRALPSKQEQRTNDTFRGFRRNP